MPQHHIAPSRVALLECVQCGATYPPADYPFGCDACAARDRHSNLFCRYGDEIRDLNLMLPYQEVPDLGQDNTPLIRLDWLDGVLVKSEAANPTGSHKDRFAAMVAAHARASGYRQIVVGSSGNAGLAVAAFAAAAGVRAVVAGFSWLPQPIIQQLRTLGAEVQTFGGEPERTAYVAELAGRSDTLAVSNVAPVVVGSNCVGIEGYKRIAWEIADEVPSGIDHIVVPSSRGDLAWGIYRGFCDLQRIRGTGIPRMHLVEPFPRLSAVLSGSDLTTRFFQSAGKLTSIAGDCTTVQAHAAVVRSGGSAVVVDERTAEDWFARACRHGHTWELSSCTTLAAYAALRERRTIVEGELTVLIATSHMFKGLETGPDVITTSRRESS